MSAAVKLRVGGIYWDGKDGIRQLVPPPAGEQARNGHVFYTVMAGPERNSATRLMMPLKCPRESMLHWAVCEVADRELPSVLDAIRASNLRLTTAQHQFLLSNFGKSIRRRPPRVEITAPAELRLAARLEALEVIQSGLDTGASRNQPTSFSLTPFGIHVVRARRGENVVATVLPQQIGSGKTPDNFVRRQRAAI